MIILYVPELPHGQTRPFIEKCRKIAGDKWPMVASVVRNPKEYSEAERLPGAPSPTDNVVHGVVVHRSYTTGEFDKPNVKAAEEKHGVEVVVVDGPSETTGVPVVNRDRRPATVDDLLRAIGRPPETAPEPSIDEGMVEAMTHVSIRNLPDALRSVAVPFLQALYLRDERSGAREIISGLIVGKGAQVPSLDESNGGDGGDSGDDA